MNYGGNQPAYGNNVTHNNIKVSADIKTADCWKSDYTAFKICKGFYGSAGCVEAVFSEVRPDLCQGVSLNQSYNGGYYCQLRKKGSKSLFLLCRRGLRSVCVDWTEINVPDGSFNQGVRLTLCCTKDEIQALLNGQPLLRFDRQGESEHFEYGECGYCVNSADEADLPVSFTLEGIPLKHNEECLLPEANRYVYNFNPLVLPDGTAPAEWTDTQGFMPFTVHKGRFTSHYPGYSESLIYEFDNNPTLHASFIVEKISQHGSFGFIFRKAPLTAFIRVGYESETQKWYADDVPAMYDCKSHRYTGLSYKLETGKKYETEVRLQDARLSVFLNGTEVLSVPELKQKGYGKTGLFSDNVRFSICGLEADFSSGTAPAENALYRCVDPEHFQGSMEIALLDGKILGISKQGLYVSYDGGLSFSEAPADYRELNPKGYYQNTRCLKSGKFIQILLGSGAEVRTSADLEHWHTIGRVVPDELLEAVGSQVMMSHVGSLTEIDLPGRGTRLFFPMHYNTNKKDKPLYPDRGHDSICYYSDDGGCSWTSSQWIGKALQQTDKGEMPDWAESKVIMCSDGTLRMYCSRNCSDYFSYMESADFGESWYGPYIIPQMQCGLSSFGIAKDPDNPGTWYAAWVNGTPEVRGAIFPRTRLSLARTQDGKKWEYLTDVERFGNRKADRGRPEDKPLFQIVDPFVLVDGGYVYISWGESMWGTQRKETARVMNDPSTLAKTHNELRPMFAKIEKASLKPQAWSDATVADMSRLTPDNNMKW